MKRRHLLNILGALVCLMGILISISALAAYPEKPVTLICVWGAGGSNDAVARSIAEHMKKYFPKPVVVVNRPGAGGTIGTSEVIQASPDGYTIGITTSGPVAVSPHQTKLAYKTPDDYVPIALVGLQTYNLNVNSEMPWKTLNDFIKYAKANPGKLRIGTLGVGPVPYFILEQLKFQAQIDLTAVHFKGGGEQIAAVLGKHVEGSIASLSETLPHYQAGKLRILAIFDEKRRSPITEILAAKELGYDIAMQSCTLLIGPKNLPADVVSKFRDAYKKVSEDPEFLKFMQGIGYTVQFEGTEELRKRLWKDYNTNKEIFERTGQK
jgi:tripartite-type tricarboxylate transporter receptor subunit TctC